MRLRSAAGPCRQLRCCVPWKARADLRIRVLPNTQHQVLGQCAWQCRALWLRALPMCSCLSCTVSPCWLCCCCGSCAWLGPAPLGHRILPALLRAFLVPANWCATSSEAPHKPPRWRSLITGDGVLFEYKGIVCP